MHHRRTWLAAPLAAVLALGSGLLAAATFEESVNTAVKGIYWARSRAGSRVLLPRGEHHATADAAAWLAGSQGALVEELPIDSEGRLAPSTLEAALEEGGAALVSTVWANSRRSGAFML